MPLINPAEDTMYHSFEMAKIFQTKSKCILVADCYTINLGTLISDNILLSSLVYAMPPERKKVRVGWSETVY